MIRHSDPRIPPAQIEYLGVNGFFMEDQTENSWVGLSAMININKNVAFDQKPFFEQNTPV